MKRRTELDCLRLVAFLAVVALHVGSSVWSGMPLWTPAWLVATLLRLTWAVPVFVMLSGRFFLDPERSLSVAALVKKMLRLLAAMAFWGVVYELFYLSRDFKNYTWKRFVAGVVTGAYHVWFLWMLLGLYAITPLLRRISDDPKLTAYFLLLHIFMQTAEYFGISLLGKPLEKVLADLQPQFVLGWSGYFLLGYFLHSQPFTRKQEGLAYAAGILSWAVSMAGNLVITAKTGAVSEFFTNYRSPLLMLQAAAVFVFFEKRLARVAWKSWAEKLLSFAGRHGFGAYLVHGLVNEYAVALVGKETLAAQPGLWIPVTTVFVAAVSFFLAWLIRKLPGIGRWVS